MCQPALSSGVIVIGVMCGQPWTGILLIPEVTHVTHICVYGPGIGFPKNGSHFGYFLFVPRQNWGYTWRKNNGAVVNILEVMI